MAHDEMPTFPGFPDFRANVTFVPIQFFTVVIPHCSRGTVRIAGYTLRKVLGWVDTQGNPTREQLQFAYRELIEKAGVSRESIAEALQGAVNRHLLVCLQTPQAHAAGQRARSGKYELCWDKDGRYTDDPAQFRGFYYPEAAVVEVREGAHTVRRPKAARKNIPNAFFDILLPRERLSVIRVVGALLFYSIQWGPGGERKVHVSRSITELSRLTKLSRHHAHEAVMEARQRGYIEQVDGGFFDPAAGQESRSATYGIRWVTRSPQIDASDLGVLADNAVDKEMKRSEKVNGASVGKGERKRSVKVNGEQSEMVNGISIKTELKTEPTTTAAVASETAAANNKPAAAVESGFDLLVKAGFSAATARHIARERSKEVIQRQIEWLARRTPARNRLGLLRRAIEQDWGEPERAPDGNETVDAQMGQAKLFASHYYAAYHGYTGEAATEPFPKDIAMGAKFVSRLLRQESNEALIPEWGRRFGRLMRDKHQGDARAKPNLTFALVLFGDAFLRMLQRECAARRKEALGKARGAHETAHRSDYLTYLQLAEKSLQQTHPTVYAAFAEERQRNRRILTSGEFLMSARTLARWESEENRLNSFAEFFHQHPQHPVFSFWEWDTRLNPRRFGGTPLTAISPEVRA